MQKSNFSEDILKRYLTGEATPEEIELLESWHINELKNSDFNLSEEEIAHAYRSMRSKLIALEPKKNTKVIAFAKAAAAVLVATLLAFSTYRLWHAFDSPSIKPGTFKNDVVAGSKLLLQIGNTTESELFEDQQSKIDSSNGLIALKADDGTIEYQVANARIVGQTVFLRVPRGGGKHKIRLADGTIAILDAGSTITFPVAFNDKIREVDVSGQAYFDVAHDKNRRFLVHINGQTVEDLGTAFNVNGFEGPVKTTLIEGRVKVGDI